mmetsp:Transcript_16080/g.32176  ORF Transcript_16080/g.32176 Transcript_16080/m.32176 type:complete len:225 (-) Transcript_16080:1167-1841(-)
MCSLRKAHQAPVISAALRRQLLQQSHFHMRAPRAWERVVCLASGDLNNLLVVSVEAFVESVQDELDEVVEIRHRTRSHRHVVFQRTDGLLGSGKVAFWAGHLESDAKSDGPLPWLRGELVSASGDEHLLVSVVGVIRVPAHDVAWTLECYRIPLNGNGAYPPPFFIPPRPLHNHPRSSQLVPGLGHCWGGRGQVFSLCWLLLLFAAHLPSCCCWRLRACLLLQS